jgi:hypothetical protein
VRRVEGLVGVAVDVTELEVASADYERQVGIAVQSDPDVAAFVERLEAAAEEEEENAEDLPSGDVIAREFQRFLRQRGTDGQLGLDGSLGLDDQPDGDGEQDTDAQHDPEDKGGREERSDDDDDEPYDGDEQKGDTPNS